jgi:hypothetical protein
LLYQIVYFDASDPARCLAPDLFVRTGVPDAAFGSWKVWERGTPSRHFDAMFG